MKQLREKVTKEDSNIKKGWCIIYCLKSYKYLYEICIHCIHSFHELSTLGKLIIYMPVLVGKIWKPTSSCVSANNAEFR